MGVNITLKNVPPAIYENLRTSAQANHRSVNSEVIACLERVLMPTRANDETHLDVARAIRRELAGRKFKLRDIETAINQGRP